MVTNTSPFSAALKESLEIGLAKNKKWTICIDADVLIIKSALGELVKLGDSLNENVFEVQTLILDKFIPVKRPSGAHMYRTALIPKALPLIPPPEGSFRPESTMLKRMAARGYPYYQSDILVGIHDYEQYYVDIFRKCLLQAKKTSWALTQLESFWNAQKDNDTDFLIAYFALLISKFTNNNITADKYLFLEEINVLFNLFKIKEKEKLNPEHMSEAYINQSIQDSLKNQHFSELQEVMMPLNLLNKT
ncbi:MAG: hypothetical protein HC896_10135 [Bacteroidales bacterium]|nr:hypothetical protein [Bacteroidales bacterium]